MSQNISATTFDLSNNPIHLSVDTEHIGIRTIMPILAFAGLAGGFILGQLIAPIIDAALSSLCLSVFFSLAGLVIALFFGERIIKPRWTSGRYINLDSHQLNLVDNRKKPSQQTLIRWHDELTTQAWYFVVPTRRSRVPKNWYCTSVRLVQDETEMILYSFVSPDTAKALPYFAEHFVRLYSKKEREEKLGQNVQWSAEQERLRRYEGQRWHDGAELAPEDFLGILALLYQSNT